MMKSIRFAALAAFALALAGCANPPVTGTTTPVTTQTPAQIAAKFCTPAQVALVGLQAVQLDSKIQDAIAKLQPALAGVCNAAAQSDNLRDLAINALPAVSSLVQSSSLAADKKREITSLITAAQIILNAALGLPAPVIPTVVATPTKI